jgi:hypothetical protein
MQSISEDRDWQYLARLYLQLAEQAERNARKDAADDPILRQSRSLNHSLNGLA